MLAKSGDSAHGALASLRVLVDALASEIDRLEAASSVSTSTTLQTLGNSPLPDSEALNLSTHPCVVKPVMRTSCVLGIDDEELLPVEPRPFPKPMSHQILNPQSADIPSVQKTSVTPELVCSEISVDRGLRASAESLEEEPKESRHASPLPISSSRSFGPTKSDGLTKLLRLGSRGFAGSRGWFSRATRFQHTATDSKEAEQRKVTYVAGCSYTKLSKSVLDTLVDDWNKAHPDSAFRQMEAEEEKKRFQELWRWFNRLDTEHEGVISAQKVLDIFNEVLDVTHEKKIEWAQDVIAKLYDQAHDKIISIMVPTTTLCISGNDLPYDNRSVSFALFIELMVWDELCKVIKVSSYDDVLAIRDGLIRNSIDQLIMTCTHMDIPMQKPQPKTWKRFIEPTVGAVILFNAVIIGISADGTGPNSIILEYFFTLFFAFEILLKWKLKGPLDFFTGEDWKWNYFDFVIVALAIVDLMLSEMSRLQDTGGDTSLGDVALVRLARLARLTRLLRLLRLLRLGIFKDLRLMVKGVVAGMNTLVWALVLLLGLIFVWGVLLRQTIGEDRLLMDDIYRTVLFGDLGWSMFTVFQCLCTAGGCALPDGTPLINHLYERYKERFVIPYVFCMVFVLFGVFNLVMAIFVENVMETARQKVKLSEADERTRICQQLRRLVLLFGRYDDDPELLDSGHKKMSTSNIARSVTELVNRASNRNLKRRPIQKVHFQWGGQVTREAFDGVMQTPEGEAVLADLEIMLNDPSDLFNILDADGTNSLDVSEIISGLLKMRNGGAEKSDIVETILSVRSVQRQLENLKEMHAKQQRMLEDHLLKVPGEPNPRSNSH